MDEIKEAERDYDSANSLLCDRHSVGINKCMVATVKHRSKGFHLTPFKTVCMSAAILYPLNTCIITGLGISYLLRCINSK